MEQQPLPPTTLPGSMVTIAEALLPAVPVRMAAAIRSTLLPCKQCRTARVKCK